MPNRFIHFLEDHMLACPSKKFLHIECPGCGLQRSVLALIQGDFYTSFQLYPAAVPILILIAFTFLHIKYKFPLGAAIIKYLYLFIAIIVAVFYIYKIIHHKITP